MENPTKTEVTVQLDEDATYKACVSFNNDVDEGMLASMLGNQDEALTHAIKAINTMAALINDLLPQEVWDRFGERQRAEEAAS